MVSDKQRKIDWVSGLTGSSLADVNSVSLSMPLSILLWSILQARLGIFNPYTPTALLVDVLLNCGAVLLAVTVYSSSPWLYNIILIVPAALVAFTSQPRRARTHGSRPPTIATTSQPSLDRLPVKPFITNYRAAMIIITCIAILAVDFQVFPRRFGKVENWGTSLMDVGVGSFVFTSGVVSVRSSLKTETGGRPSLANRLMDSLRRAVPLIILGFIRMLSVKGLDYAEHVSEYGVHWNFFFTLGFLPPFVALFQTAFDFVPSYSFLALTLASLYELALDKSDLGAFILTADRTNLLTKNREGIFSFFGYLAIFLAGQSLGTSALPREQALPKRSLWVKSVQQSVLGKLTMTAFVWTALFYLSISYYGLRLNVSRRLANLPYFLWVCSFNSYQIAICCAMERLCFGDIHKATTPDEEKKKIRDAISPVLYAFNRNGLVVFLLANLLTGLVNLSLPTLDMGPLESMGVLILYISTLATIALGLDKIDISIKL